MTAHTDDCSWITPLPTNAPNGAPQYWGCDCGYDKWMFEWEDSEIGDFVGLEILKGRTVKSAGKHSLTLDNGWVVSIQPNTSYNEYGNIEPSDDVCVEILAIP